ncbi:MAG: START domain-containing protein [Chitinophagales bacterium]|nr:START domain-containing protein [Chitinophagales bacterium]MDW8418766.1 START domain-containing protein [Chitinophagales bacterium]
MKYLLRFIALALVCSTATSFKLYQEASEWVFERERKGIKIFTKKSKWGKLRDAKAVMWVKATPEEMLRLITDFENYHTWMTHCAKARIVARLSDNEYIVHMILNAPWPIKDRDCVVRIKIMRDEKTGIITVTQTSEPRYIRENENYVRIEHLVSTWRLVPVNGGTEVTNEYTSNPGGNIPDWLTNTQSVETPLHNFENLQVKTKAINPQKQ